MRDIEDMFLNPPKIDSSHSSHKMASGYVERIEEHIKHFKEDLSKDELIDVQVVLNDGRIVFPTFFGYHNPYMIIVDGYDSSRNKCRVLINQNNIQILITKHEKTEEEEDQKIEFQKIYQ